MVGLGTQVSHGGLSPVVIKIRVDSDELVVSDFVADGTRPGVPGTGAPNAEHGFSYNLPGVATELLLSPGHHTLYVSAGRYPATSQLKQVWANLEMSPVFFLDGVFEPP